MLRIPSALLAALVLCLPMLVGCPDKDDSGTPDGGGGGNDAGQDAGPFVCRSDLDCPGQICNLLTGACEDAPDGGTTDGGSDGGSGDGGAPVCTPPATKCSDDGTAVESCAADGMTWERTDCSGATPTCFQSSCVACAPGAGECSGSTARVCRSDASGWDETDCAGLGGTCDSGVCIVCTPDEKSCKDATTLQTCNSTGTGYVETVCIDGVCDSTSLSCVVNSCTPDEIFCQGSERVQCNSAGDGFSVLEDCAANGAACNAGNCVDLCAEAVTNNSYIGCEYWPVALTNSGLDSRFHASYSVVVSNPNAGTTATVNVYEQGNATPVVTQQVVGGTLEVLTLPWNSMDAASGATTATQLGAIAYKMTSSVPVTAYQFNPLVSSLPSGCTQDTDCPGHIPFFAPNPCDVPTGACQTDFSYSNDASLLLPSHIYGDSTSGSTYVAMSYQNQGGDSATTGATFSLPGFVAIVASSPGTTNVTFTSRGATAAGGGLAALDPGGVATFALQQHDVMQIATREYGTLETSGDGLFTPIRRDWKESDLTGSIIQSDQPVAVYGGADCAFVPYNKQACDHLEQQLFPFRNWGNKYVGAASAYPQNTYGDHWRVVAAVDGTTVTFTPSSVSAPVTLNAGEKYLFDTPSSFVVESQDIDHPIMVAQYFVGIEMVITNPLDALNKNNVGDPSMVLAIPTEQYRDAYTFTTPETIKRDFITVVRPTGATVSLNGAPVTTTWAPIAGTTWEVGSLEIADGTYRLTASASVGLTVYGFDWSVSYGYPGGLDLKNIVVINPGG